MAGGAGVRLWPLSRRERPKQVLDIIGGKSLIRRAYDRVAAMLPTDAIHVIASEAHLPAIRKAIPEIPEANLIAEPVGRDTANAVALACAVLQHRDPDAVVSIFTADHLIEPVDRFAAAIERGFEAVDRSPDALVTFGIRPTRPDTNYGYVQRGESVSPGVFRVGGFKEKPEAAIAREYLASGDYYWNSGMFVWRATTMLDLLKRFLPASHSAVREIAGVWDSPERAAKLAEIYPTLEKVSIDYAVMERAPEVLVVEMEVDWLDIGAWPAMASVEKADAEGNVAVGAEVIALDATNNLLVSEDDHLVAMIGVEDLIVVHSGDATLICRKDRAADMKKLVELIKDRTGEKYL